MLPLRKILFTALVLLACVTPVWGAKITISPAALPDWTVGIPYSQTLTATSCMPCVWTEIGSLPTGVTLHAASGILSGTPSSIGSYSFTVFATSGLNVGSQAYSIVINSAIRIATASLPAGQVADPYSQTIAALGGTPPYAFSISAGSLPPGLSLASATGSISGTPSKAGSFSFTAQVTDHTGDTDVQAYTVSVSGGSPPAIATAPGLPSGTAGSAYSATLAATGGTTPYTWSIIAGALPSGLTLTPATGIIAGTPSASGTFTFTATVTDRNSLSSAQTFSLTIGTAATNPTLSLTGLPQSAASAQQITFGILLSGPYAQTITGQVTLSFRPNSANPMDDPAVQFSTGGRTATFTIPARATAAVFTSSAIAIQTGTVAGAISLSVTSSLSAATPTASVAIPAAVPAIQNATVASATGGFQVRISGYSNTRELTTAIFHFAPVSGQSVQTGNLTVSLSNTASQWFASSASDQFGGQLLLVVPFTIQEGSQSTLASVTVTLVNGQGSSQPVIVSF